VLDRLNISSCLGFKTKPLAPHTGSRHSAQPYTHPRTHTLAHTHTHTLVPFVASYSRVEDFTLRFAVHGSQLLNLPTEPVALARYPALGIAAAAAAPLPAKGKKYNY